MNINWFPGHMVAAQKKAAETLGSVDVVVEVLDARCPGASINPAINVMREHRRKPALKILNKADLADPVMTDKWLAFFNAQPNVRAIALNCKKQGESMRVFPEAQKLVPNRTGPLNRLRLMMMGVPNVGKSTLVNGLLKRRAANVGNAPAVTKSVQRYALPDGTQLYDTPGLTWPNMERRSDGLLLAANHLIGVNAYEATEVAAFTATILLARYPEGLKARYGFDAEGHTGQSAVAAVAKRRGFVMKGGELDTDKGALTLLVEYRDGILGRITLEEPYVHHR
jgi:ribosome biogenesis GTPase A